MHLLLITHALIHLLLLSSIQRQAASLDFSGKQHSSYALVRLLARFSNKCFQATISTRFTNSLRPQILAGGCTFRNGLSAATVSLRALTVYSTRPCPSLNRRPSWATIFLDKDAGLFARSRTSCSILSGRRLCKRAAPLERNSRLSDGQLFQFFKRPLFGTCPLTRRHIQATFPCTCPLTGRPSPSPQVTLPPLAASSTQSSTCAFLS